MHTKEADSEDEGVFCPICLIPIESGQGFEWIESDINNVSDKIMDFIKQNKQNKDGIEDIFHEK